MKIRAHLESLPPYISIEPFEVLSDRVGREPSLIVKLDANENPYGPLPVVREALGKLDFPHIYPDPESRALREALSKFTGIGEEYLLAGAGADELIDLLMRVMLEPGDCILSCPPTFGMYSFDAELNAAHCIEVQRNPDFSLDMESIRQAVEIHQPKILFIASPNNPDGSMLDAKTINELLSLPLLVVLDEAYIEFSDENLGASLSFIRQVPSRENLVVLRTFSKWAGLAGLRLGVLLAHRETAAVLRKPQPPFPVNVAALRAAEVVTRDRDYIQRYVREANRAREEFSAALGRLGVRTVGDLARTPVGASAP